MPAPCRPPRRRRTSRKPSPTVVACSPPGVGRRGLGERLVGLFVGQLVAGLAERDERSLNLGQHRVGLLPREVALEDELWIFGHRRLTPRLYDRAARAPQSAAPTPGRQPRARRSPR